MILYTNIVLYLIFFFLLLFIIILLFHSSRFPFPGSNRAKCGTTVQGYKAVNFTLWFACDFVHLRPVAAICTSTFLQSTRVQTLSLGYKTLYVCFLVCFISHCILLSTTLFCMCALHLRHPVLYGSDLFICPYSNLHFAASALLFCMGVRLCGAYLFVSCSLAGRAVLFSGAYSSQGVRVRSASLGVPSGRH